MLKNSFAFFVFSLLAIVLTQPVYAGGQLISLYADTDGTTNNNGLYGRVLRVYINPTYPCKDTQVTFKFVDPKDGDYVMTGSGNATYTMGDRTSSGCNTYAKMGSKVQGVRQVSVDVRNGDNVWGSPPVINVDFDGQSHGDNESNGYSYRSSIEDPYANNPYWNQYITPTAYPVTVGNLTVTMLSQQITPPHNRNVLLKWSALASSNGENSIFYSIYGKSTNSNQWKQLAFDQAGPSATVYIKGDEDYSIKVVGCIRKVGNCVDSNVLFLPKIQEEKRTITGQPIQIISSTPSGNNEKVEELNQKVSSLEGKLAESQKKQSVLEQRIGDLVSFIKRLFPFFK